MAIIVAGVLIAGAVYFSSVKQSQINVPTKGDDLSAIKLAPVDAKDRILGDAKAKVTLIMYEDFQCPWCGRFEEESGQAIRNTYVKDGKVQVVYRDFPFLGEYVKPYIKIDDESINTAQAARCAEEQGKFWEYHDYIFGHQNGENEGSFSRTNLKSFAQTLGLDKSTFSECLDSNKYDKAVADSKTEGTNAGVEGTPKGFILKDGKIVDTIGGYMPLEAVKQKIDFALK